MTMTNMPSTPVAPRVDDHGLRPAVTVAPGAPLDQAARIMRAHDISALVVGRPGELVSIVTERDLTQALADGLPPATPVDAVASPEPLTVLPDASVVDAAMLMLRHGVRHLVVARAGRAVGVLSIREVLAALIAAVTPGTILVMLEQLHIDRPEIGLG
jgi:CBS domain-containing protein